MFKKFNIVLMFILCFFIVGCTTPNTGGGNNNGGSTDNPGGSTSENKEAKIYVTNYYEFTKCYVTYVETNEVVELVPEGNCFVGDIIDDEAIIIHDGTTYLPETTFHKEKPYYYNTKWFANQINPDNIVYFSTSNDLSNPYLVFEVEGVTVNVPMRFYKTGLYYGYVDSRATTYHYQDSITSEVSADLVYSENNLYKNNALTKYEGENPVNPNPDIPGIPNNAIFMNIPEHWENCYYYMWNNEGNDKKWPGRQATKLTDNIYYFLYDEDYPNFIFNCGPEGASHPTQTQDLHIDMCDGFINPMYSLVDEKFREYNGGEIENPDIDFTETTIYACMPSGWVKIYINYEYSGYKLRKELKEIANNIYSVDIYKNSEVVYFDNGDGQETSKYNFNSDVVYYNNGSWNVFDSSILTPGDPVLPENPIFDDELDIYNALFDINNMVKYEIHISESELYKIQKDYDKFSSMGSKSPIYRMCDLTVWINDESFTIEEVGIRMKGNTSRRSFYDKNDGIYSLIHYKLKFSCTFDDEEEYNSDEIKVWESDAARKERKNRTFATLEGLEMKWNKNYDGTHIRTYLAHDLFEQNGYMAQQHNLSQVSIKHFGKLENLGIFDVTEPVDEIFLEKHLPESELGGDLYKVGWTSKGGSLTTDTLDSIGKEDELNGKFYVYDIKTNKKTTDHSALKNFINTINSSSSDLSTVCDMDMFTKFAAISYMCGNPDDYRYNYNNYYIYFLKSSNKAVFIPYDMDRCYGTTKDMNPFGDGTSKVDPLTTKYSFGDQKNPLILRSITSRGETKYVNMYIGYLKSISSSNVFSTDYVNSIYSVAKSYYGNVYEPTITKVKSWSIRFTMNDDNYSISQYISNIKSQINNTNYK